MSRRIGDCQLDMSVPRAAGKFLCFDGSMLHRSESDRAIKLRAVLRRLIDGPVCCIHRGVHE